jgi:hypothetical protein
MFLELEGKKIIEPYNRKHLDTYILFNKTLQFLVLSLKCLELPYELISRIGHDPKQEVPSKMRTCLEGSTCVKVLVNENYHGIF